MEANNCKNCGANLTHAQGGMVNCPYCGTSYHTEEANASGPPSSEVDTVKKDITISEPKTQPDRPGYWVLPQLSAGERKFQLYKNAALWFFLLWVGLYFFRLEMPDAKTNLSQHHNLVFSPILGVFWWIRGVLFLGLFPGIASLLIYNFRYKNK